MGDEAVPDGMQRAHVADRGAIYHGAEFVRIDRCSAEEMSGARHVMAS